MLPNVNPVKLALSCKCPKCAEGAMFEPGFTIKLKEECSNCKFELSKNDSADGPAVFLIFILGAALVPLALVIDAFYSWPLWLHAIIWTVASLGLTLGSLKHLKAYIIALQYKYRASDWEE